MDDGDVVDLTADHEDNEVVQQPPMKKQKLPEQNQVVDLTGHDQQLPIKKRKYAVDPTHN